MDRRERSGASIGELGAVFAQAVLAAALVLLTADLDGIERCLQAVSRQVLGRVVEQFIAARVAALGPVVSVCERCGAPMRYVGRAQPRRLRSPGLSRVASRLGSEGAFGAAADQVAEALGVTVPEEAVRRIAEGLGSDTHQRVKILMG